MRFLINRLPMARFRVEQATAKATRCTASLTGMPRGGGNGSQVENGAELRDAALAALTEIKAELEGLRAEVRPMIEALRDPLEKTAAEMRYLDGCSVREIAYRINYSEQHIFRALQRAEEKMLKDESHES